MIQFIRRNIECILLVSLYSWICFCSIQNMGSIAGLLFTLLVICIALKSARASFCVMISLLFCPMASLNMPSPIIISSAIIFICNIRKLNIYRKQLVLSKLCIPFFLYIVIRVVSYLQIINTDMYVAALKIDLITLVSLMLAVFLIKDFEDVGFIEHWIGLLGVLATIYGLFYFIYNDGAYLGQLYADTDFAGKGVIGDAIKAWLRWVPIDKEPNFWAACLLFSFGFWLNRVSNHATAISLIGLSVVYIGILFSYSRSSFLVASIVLLYLFFIKNRYSFIYIVLAFIAIFVCVNIFAPEMIERIFSIKDNIKSEGGSGRFELWGEAINNFFRNPIIGIGTGQTPAYSLTRMGTHNLYLQILGENGIIGFSLFLVIWLSAFFRMRRYRRYNGFYYYAILGYSINLMTVHNFDLRIPIYVVILFYILSQNSIKCSKNHQRT